MGASGDDAASQTNQLPRTICRQGFLLLLKKLRVIFLQDSVFLKVDYPHHSLFHNALFRDPEYLEFEGRLLTTCCEQDSLQEMKLKEVVPEIEHVLTNLNMTMDTVTSLISTIDSRPAPMHESSQLTSISASMRHVFENFNQLKNACSYFANGSSGELIASDRPLNEPNSENTPAIRGPSRHAVDKNESSAEERDQPVCLSNVPTYQMKRWVKTVLDLWLKFTVGLEGYFAVNELNILYKASWRKDEKDIVQ